MKIEFPGHEEELESIEAFLERHTFPEIGELKNFLNRLKKIDRSIDSALQSSEFVLSNYLEKQKNLVKKLAGRCHQLEVRKSVIRIAEDAEKLANTSPSRSHDDIAREAHLLRDRIDRFVEHHRPSRTNAKFIRFARACINKAEKHEPLIVPSKKGKSKKSVSLDNFRMKEASEDSLGLAELLYDLARVLYQEKFDEFEEAFLNNFSKDQQKEIQFHASKCSGSLTQLKNQTIRLKTVQGILGYAHELADYYLGDTPYPSLIEIHNIFQDLDFVDHIEESEK